jgi:glucose/mannose-6-phosphate isomerase
MKEITTEALTKLDRSNMLGLLMDFPRQCQDAIAIADKAKLACAKEGLKKIVFAGLGGSAIGADLVRSYLYFECKLPIQVVREYDLPACVDDSTLVFICSYSGDTEETLSAYKLARDKKAVIIAISSGGKIQEYARADNITFIQIPKGFPPRCALGYLSIVPLAVLAKLGLVSDPKPMVDETVRMLEGLRDKELSPAVAQKKNIAKSLASKLLNKLGVVYSGSVHFDVCAVRLRGQIAENSKALSWSHFFPEMNHNEIVGWKNPRKLFKNILVLMLRDSKMHPRVAKRMDISAEMIKKEGVELIEVWSRSECLLSRIFSLIYIGDFISYYLAILYGIDPTPVESVTYLKNKLAER